MVAEDYATPRLGIVSQVVEHLRQARKVRNGRNFHEARRRRRVRGPCRPAEGHRVRVPDAGVNCMTVDYKNTAEIDEAIENLNKALVLVA